MQLIQPIELSFTSHRETMEQVYKIVLRQVTDIFALARNDKERLQDLHRMFKEGAWITGDLLNRIYQAETEEKSSGWGIV